MRRIRILTWLFSDVVGLYNFYEAVRRLTLQCVRISEAIVWHDGLFSQQDGGLGFRV